MIVPHQTSYSENNHYCPPSSCGNIHAITHPFRLSGDPRYCGDPRYELSCKNNLTVLYTQDKRHYLYVHTINYNNYTIRVVDPNVHKDNLASSPSYLIAKYEIIRDDRFETEIRFATATEDHSHLTKFGNVHQLTQTLIFLSCEKKVNNSQRHNYIDTAPWMINNSALSQSRRRYSYVVVDRNLSLSDLAESCCIDQMSLFSTRKEIEIEKKNIISSYIDIHNEIAHGFELSWVPSYCYTFGVECLNCYVDEDSNKDTVAGGLEPLLSVRISVLSLIFTITSRSFAYS
ncbi:Wall-associated receptor kinase, galacturonan-binding domain containing protein [Trema orientale]|uniref:Wall-associated receptor kinase, galacturonan-binding domain containing protein n=1 Tax=Trema orientale TaxID=63057 RepID=A0A2P5F8P0_TREOI|nr:Wall-associated receptor kinase, galacturonan-binding domain containing protein [Trema orientale]